MIMRALAGSLMALTAVSSLAAPPLRVPLVLAAGQKVTHATAAPLLTVTVVPPGSVVAQFDQYGTTVRLTGVRPGDAKVLCEYVDTHIGEVLVVSVVPREVAQQFERTSTALGGIEGLDAGSIVTTRTRVAVTGNVYASGDLQRCIAIEHTGAETRAAAPVCAVHLSSAAAAVHPELGYVARASLQLEERAAAVGSAFTSGMEGSSTWSITIRYGDVPFLRAAASDRQALLGWAVPLVSRLNDIADRVGREAQSRHAYPVTFDSSAVGADYRINGHWNFNQGSGGELLARVPAAHLEDAGRAAGTSGDRFLRWSMALLQDAFRAYVLAERPLRTVSGPTSPLRVLYDEALRLRGSQLTVDSAAVSLARAYFSQEFAAGHDPLAGVLAAVPAEPVP
jgi:hypothetical protein